MQRTETAGVLILHNAPRATEAHCESDADVLEQVEAVRAALERSRAPHRVAAVGRLREVPAILASAREDVVFNLVESFHDHPAHAVLVPALCAAYEKGCTGCDDACQALALDKWQCKLRLQSAGLPTPPCAVVRPGERLDAAALPKGKLIVKPACSDASEGVDADSIVDGPGAALEAVVQRVHRDFRQPALIEQFFGSREINISLVQFGSEVRVMPIAEIGFGDFAPDQPRIVGYRAKWVQDSFEYHHTPRMIPAPLTNAEADTAQRLALAAWGAVGCRDYARVDMRLDDQGRFSILEVNPNPCIAPSAGFPAALAAGGIAFEAFVAACIGNARSRCAATEGPESAASPRRTSTEVCLRPLEPRDKQAVLELLAETARFRENELDIAAEVLDQAIYSPQTSGYVSQVADVAGEAVGWVCLGATPCTVGTYDVYWLGVSPRQQRRGIASRLMRYAEDYIRAQGGRLSVVETSGRPDYDQARGFYESQGYIESARLRDFYAPGDDKIVYLKRVAGRMQAAPTRA